MILRKAHIGDLESLLALANERLVRQYSFQSGFITRDVHKNWFESKLEDKNCVFYIAEDEKGNFIGQVRFDINEDKKHAVISVSIIPDYRGFGFGRNLIVQACDTFMEEHCIWRILAYIKIDNMASRRAFKNAGFEEDNTILAMKKDVIVMMVEKKEEA